MTPTLTKRGKPALKPHRLHVALQPEQFAALRDLRRETGAPIAELLRRAIALYIAQPFNRLVDEA